MRRHGSIIGTLGLGLAIITLFTWITAPAGAQSSAFSYQGQLKDGSIVADADEARMVFRLFDAAAGGNQMGSDWVTYPVEIQDGLFTTQVDFGSGPLSMGDRWLEIGVDTSGGTKLSKLRAIHV